MSLSHTVLDVDHAPQNLVGFDTALSPSSSDTIAASVHGKMKTAEDQSGSAVGDSSLISSSTLDEPIRDTFMRDLRAVAAKFRCVCWPRKADASTFFAHQELLRDWDLWGPLILCTMLALGLRSGSNAGDGGGGPEFAEVFVVVWLGSAAVTVNTQLLGGAVSFFQSVCVLGYCLLPCVAALLVSRFALFILSSMAAGSSAVNLLVAMVATSAGLLWSIFSAVRFLGELHPSEKRTLGIYPIVLLYFVISWMIVSDIGL